MTLRREDKLGLQKMRDLYNEFLQTDHSSSDSVRSYLKVIIEKDDILLSFLWGRKFQAQYAWETLKRNAEVRFNECPELFPDVIPMNAVHHVNDKNIVGVLKERDFEGRHVLVVNAGAWDPNICSLEELIIIFIRLMEQLLKVEDFSKHGFIYIQQCLGVTFNHARQYSLKAIQNLIKVFWHSFPIQLKGLYYINVPHFLHYVFVFGRMFYPVKLKDRLVVSPVDRGCQDIHCVISPNKLPKFLDGKLEFQEAMDETLFRSVISS